MADLKLVFRALRARNYRLFFIGQCVSTTGTWMQQVAASWLVYRLTHSPFLLGLVGFAGQIPTFLAAPVAGVLVDRWDRRRILVVTQILAMAQAFLLALLTLTRAITVWQILWLGVALALITAFDIPARQALLVDMIERREDLGNAIALNSSLFNGARLVGPFLAGLLIATAGEGVCFLINGASYLAAIAALLAMRLVPKREVIRAVRVLQGFKDGLAYAFGSTPIRMILELVGWVSLVGVPYAVLLPVVARDVLNGGPQVFGALMGASGLGAVAGAMALAWRTSPYGLEGPMIFSAGLFGAGLVALALSHAIWLSLFSMFVVGFGMIVQMASGNTVLQTIVDDDKRGRVMSLFMAAFMGMAPVGALLAGALAHQIGASTTLLLGGAACVAACAVFLRRLPVLREAVQAHRARLGAVPEIVSGIQAVTQPAVPRQEGG